MKRAVSHPRFLLIAITAAAIASGPAGIDYDSLAGYAGGGPHVYHPGAFAF